MRTELPEAPGDCVTGCPAEPASAPSTTLKTWAGLSAQAGLESREGGRLLRRRGTSAGRCPLCSAAVGCPPHAPVQDLLLSSHNPQLTKHPSASTGKATGRGLRQPRVGTGQGSGPSARSPTAPPCSRGLDPCMRPLEKDFQPWGQHQRRPGETAVEPGAHPPCSLPQEPTAWEAAPLKHWSPKGTPRMWPWSGFVPKARHGALGCERVGLTVAAGSRGWAWPGKGGPTTKATPVGRGHSPRQWSSWPGVSGTFHIRKGSLGPDPHLPDFCSERIRDKAAADRAPPALVSRSVWTCAGRLHPLR